MRRLPIEKEWRRLPRKWIVDIVFSTVPNDFKAWLDQRVDARDDARRNTMNMDIAMTQEAIDQFKKSNYVSSTVTPLFF
jgi:hypothetical protein